MARPLAALALALMTLGRVGPDPVSTGIIRGQVVATQTVVSATRPAVSDLATARHDPVDRRRSVVYLESAPRGAFEELRPGRVKMDQRGQQFIPRVLVAREGDTIEFKNSAPVNHNVNYSSDAESFNNNMAPSTSKKTQPLKYQFGPITFKCDIHPDMKGNVVAR